MTDVAVAAVPLLPVLSAVLLLLVRGSQADRLNIGLSTLTAGAACTLAIWVLASNGESPHGAWYAVDAIGAVFLIVVAVIGLLSALTSPGHLSHARASFFGSRAPRRSYYVAFQAFWAALLAIPLVDNLAAAWILVEATTAASALLVASGGARRALEAGWKYLVLTTLGLTVALLGILVLYAAMPHRGSPALSVVDWASIRSHAVSLDHQLALISLVLIVGGLAAKIGWAPVHNWLPDAHSEAPAPVSALLSAALLPTVMLVAWRSVTALEPAVDGAGTAIFLGFGLGSLMVAVPFLWRPLPLKRLLAYSSLEHMGVLALGIGFASPLATAGVIVHVAGHALAKSLGFYAAIPLVRANPRLAAEPPSSLSATSPAGAAAVGTSLASLSGLPPSPLFFSEVLILAGGVAAGQIAIVAIAAVSLALGFLGLAHSLIESIAGDASPQTRHGHRAERQLTALTSVVGCGLLLLSVAAFVLPGSGVLHDVMRSIG